MSFSRNPIKSLRNERPIIKRHYPPGSRFSGEKSILLVLSRPERQRTYNDGVDAIPVTPCKPSTVVWKVDGYQRLPLFWIYKEDFLKAIEYSKWAKEFERDVVCDACFAFPDYEKCKADKVGKKLEP